jgi:bacterioferritin (cytochrome b1)
VAKGDDKDPLDREGAIEQLNRALTTQYRSVLQYTVAAASATGFAHQGLSDHLWSFAQAELTDLRRLIEKIVALGGEPATDVEPPRFHADPAEAVGWLLESEPATIEALQDTIPHTGHTGDSEALEHRLEHIIMRKQEQLDTLVRARGHS